MGGREGRRGRGRGEREEKGGKRGGGEGGKEGGEGNGRGGEGSLCARCDEWGFGCVYIYIYYIHPELRIGDCPFGSGKGAGPL